jgi:Tfp pilus assembly protein PilF
MGRRLNYWAFLAAWLLVGAAGAPATAQRASEVEAEDLPESTFIIPMEERDPVADEEPDPEHPEGGAAALEAEAEESYLAGDLETAFTLYRSLLALTDDPRKHMEVAVAAAWLGHQLGESWEAREILVEGLRKDLEFPFQPENYPQTFVSLYQDAVRQVEADRKASAAVLVREAAQRMAHDELGRAEALLQEALRLVPSDPVVLYNIAVLEQRRNRPDAALAGFERLLAIEMARPGALTAEILALTRANVGLLYVERGNPEDALPHLREALRLDPDSPRSWNNLGLALRRLSHDREAQEAFRRALELSPGDPQIANNLAVAWIASESWADAVSLLERTARQHPTDLATWLHLGLARRGQGDLGGAAAALERVLELDPDNRHGSAAMAASYLALVEYQRNHVGDAAAAARQALTWNPDDTDAHLLLGLSLQVAGDLEAAKASFETARRLDPTRAEIHNNFGTVMVALGELEEAERAFRQALAMRPDFAEAEANLEMVVARRESLAQQAAASETRGPRGREARPVRSLGLSFDEADFSYLGIRGAVVREVRPGSPAAAAGIRRGDVILGVDGRQVDGPQGLLHYINAVATEDQVVLDLLREGSPRRIRVRIR